MPLDPSIRRENVNRAVDNRKLVIALAMVVAFVAIVVPTCRMVGCSMEMTGYMGFMHPGSDAGFFSDCGGTYVGNSTPSAVVPAGADTLTLALTSAVMAALALFMPVVSSQPARVAYFAPPPPPEDPRGERLRL